MSVHSAARVMSAKVPVHIQGSPEVLEDVRRLITLAAKGLVSMFDTASQLFCFKLRKSSEGLVREGLSPRYTMITLMGLQRLEANGGQSPIDIKSVFEGLVANTGWIDNVGDLGLLLWLASLMSPERLPELNRHLEVESALTRFGDARRGKTMELAWFLAGLSHEGLAYPKLLPATRDLAFETYRRLLRNQSEQGVFGHLARNKSFAGIVRGRVGSFADQVYPIYAMSKFSQAYSDRKASERALDCALTICEAQGPFGQWWWHYDSVTGRVVDGFPVFSVHQHGMAPMVLFALGEAIKSDFSPWIYKGLQWLKDNELDFDMEDAPASLVWRCIDKPTSKRYWSTAVSVLTAREDQKSRQVLNVLHECRPYELGWLLYAFADKVSQ